MTSEQNGDRGSDPIPPDWGREFLTLLDTVFPRRGRRALVLCDGKRPGNRLIELVLKRSDFFVCTDAAGIPHEDLPGQPDLVIGDFDTLDRMDIPRSMDPRFERLSEQDSTDSEKAMRWLCDHDYTEAVLLGATGGRLDHSLFNVHLLERFAGRLRICIADERGIATRLEAGEEASFDLPAGTSFSLLPLAGPVDGLSIEGARYPLDESDLSHRAGNALSNTVTGKPLRLAARAGALLFWVCLDELLDPGEGKRS